MCIQLRFLVRSRACRVALTSLFALAPILLPAPGPAGTAPALSRRVSVADLNLARPEGVAVLYARIRGAAKTVCHPFEGGSLRLRLLWRDCVHDAVDHAVADFAHPALTALHLAVPGRATAPGGIATRR